MTPIQDIQCHIYAVELENKKFIIHHSNQVNTPEILQECTIIYEWARTYNPINVCESFDLDNDTPLIIDYFVKKYMQMYGIDNVRGGSYFEPLLSDMQMKMLEYEFSIPKVIAKNNNFYKDYVTNYKNHYDLRNTIAIITEKWISQTNHLKELQMTPNGKIIDRTFIPEIKWLKSTLELIMTNVSYNNQYNIKMHDIDKNIILRYRQIIPCLKHLYAQARKMRDDIVFEQMCYLENPEFLFDTIICHSHTKPINVLTDVCNLAIALHERFEYMMYLIINRSDEIIFDIENP